MLPMVVLRDEGLTLLFRYKVPLWLGKSFCVFALARVKLWPQREKVFGLLDRAVVERTSQIHKFGEKNLTILVVEFLSTLP